MYIEVVKVMYLEEHTYNLEPERACVILCRLIEFPSKATGGTDDRYISRLIYFLSFMHAPLVSVYV